MKRKIAALLLVALMQGCATVSPEMSAIKANAEADQIALERGAMKLSEFYLRRFDDLSASPSIPGRLIQMQSMLEMSKLAKALESGRITEDEFEIERRRVLVNGSIAMERQFNQDEAALRERYLERIRRQDAPPKSTCTTRQVLNTLETVCK